MKYVRGGFNAKYRRGGVRKRWVETIIEYMELESEYATRESIKIRKEAPKREQRD